MIQVYNNAKQKRFVSDFRQVGGFLRVLQFPPPIKLTTTAITEILLKVALNTITINQNIKKKQKKNVGFFSKKEYGCK